MPQKSTGSGGFGNSANLIAASPVTFVTGEPTSAENMGQGLADEANICQANGICSFDPNAGAALPGDLTTFAGEASDGTWSLCLGDAGGGDTGSIDAVTLTVQK